MRDVLIVEDNERNMRLMRLMLRPLQCRLHEATSGTAALALLQHISPALILMDIQLPDIDGLEITRRIRREKHLANTPIIALTAYAMPGDREMFLEAGCTDYVAKPIEDRRAFLDIIERYINATPTQDAAHSPEAHHG